MTGVAGLPLLDQMRKRYEVLRSEFSMLEPHYRDITKRLLPRNGRFIVSDRNKAAARRNSIIDNAGMRMHRIMTAGMLQGASSPARPWHRLQLPDPDLNKRHAVKEWLSAVEDLQRRVWARSNTYGTLQHLYGETGGYGTACTTVMPHSERVLHCYPQTVGQYVLAVNPEGRVNTMMRRFEMTVAQVIEQFGKNKVSEATRNAANNHQWHMPVTVVHAIEPRPKRDGSMLDAANMPWRSVYWEEGHDNEIRDVLRESGFRNFPVLAPRWTTSPGDSYGSNCPGMEALGDLISLDALQWRKGQAYDYQSKPPTQGPPGTKKRLDKRPGAHNEVEQTGTQAAIRPLWEVRMDVAGVLDDIRDHRERIASSFFADLFLMLASTPKTMTATEVAERHEEKLLMLGPVLDRLHHEMLEPLVDLTFTYLDEAGLLPPPPPEIEGMPISVEFVSTLAQAQRMVQSTAVDRWVVGMAGMSQLKPEVLDKLDADEWADQSADMLGVPPAMVVANEDVAELRRARLEAQQAQAVQDAMQVQAGTALDLAKAQQAAPDVVGAGL